MKVNAQMPSGRIWETAIITECRRRGVPLARLARAAGFRRTSTFRRFLRAGECTTSALERAAGQLGMSLYGIARTALSLRDARPRAAAGGDTDTTTRGEAR